MCHSWGVCTATHGCTETLRTVRTGCCAGHLCRASLAAQACGQVNPAATKSDRLMIQWKLLKWWINVQIPQTVNRVRAIVSLEKTLKGQSIERKCKSLDIIYLVLRTISKLYLVMLVFPTIKLTQAEGIMKLE